MKRNKRKLVIEWALRLAGLGLVGAAIAAWRPGILGGFLHSFRAMGLVAAGFIALVVLEWWLRRRGKHILGRGVFYTLLVVGILAAVVPSFIETSVAEKESDFFRHARSAPTATNTPNRPAGPIELGSAALSGIDHRASGTVRVARDTTGQLAVRFEGLDIEPGPDYYVWIVPGADQETPEGGTNLGRIKGNKGDQEYRADTTFMAETPLTVLIWCRAFAVPIGNATIS